MHGGLLRSVDGNAEFPQACSVAGLSGRDVDLHCHSIEIGTNAIVAAAQWHRLAGITGNGNANKVSIADNAVGRIELRPAGSGKIDLAPGVGRASPKLGAAIPIGDIDVAGDETRGEPELTGRFHHQQGKVATRA
ncbi:hypothetical protein EV286_11719 [Rhizobium sp. BK251]|nr:hypothetical protein EV286_11719 [Rhizobium sp. BK251]